MPPAQIPDIAPMYQDVDIQKSNPPLAAPKTAEVDEALPAYKNRYALYVADLKTFEQTKSWPENEALNQSLNKLSSNRTEILFQGQIN